MLILRWQQGMLRGPTLIIYSYMCVCSNVAWMWFRCRLRCRFTDVFLQKQLYVYTYIYIYIWRHVTLIRIYIYIIIYICISDTDVVWCRSGCCWKCRSQADFFTWKEHRGGNFVAQVVEDPFRCRFPKFGALKTFKKHNFPTKSSITLINLGRSP